MYSIFLLDYSIYSYGIQIRFAYKMRGSKPQRLWILLTLISPCPTAGPTAPAVYPKEVVAETPTKGKIQVQTVETSMKVSTRNLRK